MFFAKSSILKAQKLTFYRKATICKTSAQQALESRRRLQEFFCLGVDPIKTAKVKALLEELDRKKPEWLREHQRQMDEALYHKQAREGWVAPAAAAGAIAAGSLAASTNSNTAPTPQDTAQTDTATDSITEPNRKRLHYNRTRLGDIMDNVGDWWQERHDNSKSGSSSGGGLRPNRDATERVKKVKPRN